jgi:hypothetical protein
MGIDDLQNSDTSSKNVKFKNVLTIGAGIGIMLPILGAALVALYWLFYDFLVHKDQRGFFLLQDFGHLAALLTPFLVGVIVVWFFMRKRRIILGLVIGIGIVVAPYLLWFINYNRSIVECAKTEPMCGEWSLVIFAFDFFICLINFLALIGFTVLISTANKIRKPIA